MEREAPHDGHLVSVVSVIDSSITTHTQLFLVSSNLERATHAVHQPAVQVDTGQSVSIFMLQFHLFSIPLCICTAGLFYDRQVQLVALRRSWPSSRARGPSIRRRALTL